MPSRASIDVETVPVHRRPSAVSFAAPPTGP